MWLHNRDIEVVSREYSGGVKKLSKVKGLLVCLLLLVAPLQAPAQPRSFNQGELDALLAPIALYPDVLLNQILEASRLPDQVRHAAYWSRNNPQLSGDPAVNAAQSQGWHPSVAALTAFPDVLQRLDENPQWLRDLGDAYAGQEPHVMETVQQLRRRAEASGNLRSDDNQRVYREGDDIVVQPAYAQAVVVPYYSPLIVFGGWWWASYRPVIWRPFVVRPVACNWNSWQRHAGGWRQRPGNWHDRPGNGQPRPDGNRWRPDGNRWRPDGNRWHPNGTPSPAARQQAQQTAEFMNRQRALAQPSPAARIQLAKAMPTPRINATPQAPAMRAPSHSHAAPRIAAAAGGHFRR